MSKTYETLFYIGRFQPVHQVHYDTFFRAKQMAENVVVLPGSTNVCNLNNPFTYEERVEMFQGNAETVRVECNVYFEPLPDTYSEENPIEAWIENVRAIIKKYDDGFSRIGIIGCDKDHTSDYLNWFPECELVLMEKQDGINATDIRLALYEGNPIPESLPLGTRKVLENSTSLTYMATEYQYIKQYNKAWEAAPFPVKHVTVDCVIQQGDKFLMITRKGHPGIGKLAIPGGHLEQYEEIDAGILRELREETGLENVEQYIVDRHIFADPYRSDLGRVITHAAYAIIPENIELKPVAQDDAEFVHWLSVDEIDERKCHDDHYSIIKTFIRRNQ